ncbi:MAG: FRG domain-containing protein [Terracidiphilus sp.]
MEANETLDWETFEQKVKELRGEYYGELSPLLFRGQGNSKWRLTTTLERSGTGRMLFREYYQLICASMGPEVKTFAGIDVPTFDPKLCEPFLDPALLYDTGDVFPIPVYRYMAYLRHFGFPSPLLDWSRSPSLRHSSHSETISMTTMPRRDRFSFIAKSLLGGRGRGLAIRKSVRSGPMFRHMRGISASAAITQFVAAMTRTMGGGLIRTKLSSIWRGLKGRTFCGSSISLQVNGRRFWVR